MTTRQRVVLFPMPLKGHMNPMLQLGSKLYSKGLSISVIHTKFNSPDPADYPMFTFHFISDGLSEAETSLRSDTAFFTTINKKCEQPFRDCLSTLVADGNPTSTVLIVDPFWHFARAVAHSLNMRTIAQMFMSVYCSYIFWNYRDSHCCHSREEKEMDKMVAEFAPLKMKDIPSMSLEDPEQERELMLKITAEKREYDGIVFNSFKELESEALAKLEKELSVPLFPCGPLLVEAAPLEQHKKCLSWLDEQQPSSVVYISLGSLVSLTKSDFHELVWGVATSSHPFLLVVHSGLVREKDYLLPPHEVMSRGLVVEWAPQQEVLAHPAVGGFLTHCGWNSALESICGGVPMLCIPFFADHLANARVVSEVWKIGDYFEERINRSTVQQAITRLMQVHEDGEDEIRANIAYFKNMAKQSWQVGGSSYEALDNLVQHINQKH